MSLEVQGHTVSLFEALISDFLEPRGLRYDSTFILCHFLLKIAILLHTEGLVKFHSGRTVLPEIEPSLAGFT